VPRKEKCRQERAGWSATALKKNEMNSPENASSIKEWKAAGPDRAANEMLLLGGGRNVELETAAGV
jgi:hypothetical protein